MGTLEAQEIERVILRYLDSQMKFFQSEDFEIAEQKINRILSDMESTEQILEAGEFQKDGIEFAVTTDMLASFVNNFNERVLGTDPPVNFSHDRGGNAAGWIKNVFTDPTGTKLFALIKWTAAGLEALRGLEFRYLSAEFTEAFFDGSTRQSFGPTLAGAALTNVPFLRHMPAVVGLSQDDRTVITLSQEERDDQMSDNKDVISLSDHRAQVKVLADANEKLQAELSTLSDEVKELRPLKDSNVKLTKEISELKSDIARKERESQFEKLLSEGKACEAQREPYMENDMDKYIELAQPINLKGTGSGANPGEKLETFDDMDAEEKSMYHTYHEQNMSKEEYFARSRGLKWDGPKANT